MEDKTFWELLDEIELNVRMARQRLDDEHEGLFKAHVNSALDRLYELKRRVDDM